MSVDTEFCPLSWSRQDPERRLMMPAAYYTRVSSFTTGFLATLLTIAVLSGLLLFKDRWISQTIWQRGPVPFAIVFFTCWSLIIIFLKWLKLRLQRRALDYQIVPPTPDFVLSPESVAIVQNSILDTAEDPQRFVLFNRINIALANLKNLGRVGDVDEILRSQADNDEGSMETSYATLRGFVWAIPVLGFIGTVQGLAEAIGGFGAVLSQSDDLSHVKDALKGVTGGLSVAFETTLQGLVAALIVQLLMTSLKKSEEEFLDHCRAFCTRNVTGKLRLMPFEKLHAE